MDYEKREAKEVSKINDVAEKYAHEIMDGFNLQEQNQAIVIIKNCFRDKREKLLSEADRRCENLKGSLEELNCI